MNFFIHLPISEINVQKYVDRAQRYQGGIILKDTVQRENGIFLMKIVFCAKHV